MKRQNSRFKTLCPYPPTPIYKTLRQYSKPLFSVFAISVIAFSILIASTLTMNSALAPPPIAPVSATPTPTIGVTDNPVPSNQSELKQNKPNPTGDSPLIPPSVPTTIVPPTIPTYISNETHFNKLTAVSPSTMIRTSDGGFVVSGSYNNSVLLTKYGATGVFEWNSSFSPNSNVKAVIQTSDGGYAMSGSSRNLPVGDSSSMSGQYLFFAKVDERGNLLFNLTAKFGAISDSNNILQTSDGGYVMTVISSEMGGHGPFCKLWKLYANGTEQWRSYTFNSYSNSIFQNSDGSFMAVGYYLDSNLVESTYYFSLAKIAYNGSILWGKQFSNGIQGVTDVATTPDGGYLILDGTTDLNKGKEILLTKIDRDANIQWRQTYGGSKDDLPAKIICTNDGGYAIIGSTQSASPDKDAYLLKIYANGTQQWDAAYGTIKTDTGCSLLQSANGGYLILGSTNLDKTTLEGWLLFTDSNGKPQP